MHLHDVKKAAHSTGYNTASLPIAKEKMFTKSNSGLNTSQIHEKWTKLDETGYFGKKVKNPQKFSEQKNKSLKWFSAALFVISPTLQRHFACRIPAVQQSEHAQLTTGKPRSQSISANATWYIVHLKCILKSSNVTSHLIGETFKLGDVTLKCIVTM